MEKPRLLKTLHQLNEEGFLNKRYGVAQIDNQTREGIEDETLTYLGPEEKSKYKHFSTYSADKKKDEDTAFSDEFKEYRKNKIKDDWRKLATESDKFLRDMYSKAEEKNNPRKDIALLENKTNITTFTNKPELEETHTTTLVHDSHNDDILNPLPVAIENLKNNTTSSPAENAVVFERKPLSKEDGEIQKEIYKEAQYLRSKLEKIYGDKRRDELNARELKDFIENPYAWMEMKFNSSIRKKLKELENPDSEMDQGELSKELNFDIHHLNNLKKSFERSIPLKLERNFNANQYVFKSGDTFKVDTATDELNKYFKKEYSNYTIIGVVQKRNDVYLVLKTDTDQELEIDIRAVGKITNKKEVEERVNQEKEERFAKIHEGSIIRVRIGGPREPTTVYKIIKMKENGSVVFENLTLKRKEPNMSFESMKKFLFGPKVEFILEEEKRGAATMMPTENRKSATDTPETGKNIEIQNRMNEVLKVESDLGFELNTPALLERYIQGISKEDAKVLFDEYKKLRSKEPATFPDVVEPISPQEPEVNPAEKPRNQLEKLQQELHILSTEIEELKATEIAIQQELESRKDK